MDMRESIKEAVGRWLSYFAVGAGIVAIIVLVYGIIKAWV